MSASILLENRAERTLRSFPRCNKSRIDIVISWMTSYISCLISSHNLFISEVVLLDKVLNHSAHQMGAIFSSDMIIGKPNVELFELCWSKKTEVDRRTDDPFHKIIDDDLKIGFRPSEVCQFMQGNDCWCIIYHLENLFFQKNVHFRS